MFEAAVIICLALWALIIFIFIGFTSGLVFILFVMIATLSCIAFMLVQLSGIMAGFPIIMYIFALTSLVVFATFVSNPNRIKHYLHKLKNLISSRGIPHNQ